MMNIERRSLGRGVHFLCSLRFGNLEPGSKDLQSDSGISALDLVRRTNQSSPDLTLEQLCTPQPGMGMFF